MAGLRDRQKLDRRRRILQSAVTLFRDRGFRAVRLEDLAERADVSVGTVYNYYRTKGDILMAVVALEVEEVLETGRRVVADPPRGAEWAVRALTHAYYDHSLNYLNKEMWRTAMALAIEAPETPNGQRYAALDRKLARQMTELICTLRDRNEVRETVDVSAVGQLLFNNLNQMFMEFVRNDGMSLDHLKRIVADQTRPLAHMIATESP